MVSQERVHQETLSLYHTGDEQLDRYQRIETLQYVAEFLPASKPEQIEAMGLQSFINTSGGAARHIAEVARRQHTKARMEDPTATSRRIVRDYVNWMTDAHDSSRALATLETELKEVFNPQLRVSLADELSQEGLLKFMRFYDLSLLTQTGSIEAVGYDPQKVSYNMDNGGILFYLDIAKESWRVQQVRKRLPQAQQHEAKRFIFWAERLDEIVTHSPKDLKAIAHEGFDKLRGRRDKVQ